MKFLLPLIFALFPCSALFAQSGIDWQAPIEIANNGGDKSAEIAVLGDGTPIVVWGKGSTIYFSRMEDEQFSAPLAIATAGISPQIYGFGGLDVATYENQVHVVFENFNDGVYLLSSMDGGDTFGAPVSVYDPPAGKWATLASVEMNDQGKIFVSVIFENTNETEGKFIMMHSDDGGQTFTEPVIASEPADGDFVCECCPSDIYAKGEEAWLVFRNNDDNLRDMWVSKSSDGGLTFTEAVDVDDTDWVLQSCPIAGPRMCAFGGDSLVTAWSSGATGTGRVYLHALNREDMVAGKESQLPLSNVGAFQQSADIAGANDTIGLVWSESGFGVNGIDVLFSLSLNGSQNLTTDFKNLSEAIGSQNFPSLAFANGAFHLIYTNSAGGLDYRFGFITEETAVVETQEENVCFELLHDHSGFLQIKNACEEDAQEVQPSLYDLSGKLIKNWNKQLLGEAPQLLELMDFASGAYVFVLRSDAGIWSERIIIEQR